MQHVNSPIISLLFKAAAVTLLFRTVIITGIVHCYALIWRWREHLISDAGLCGHCFCLFICRYAEWQTCPALPLPSSPKLHSFLLLCYCCRCCGFPSPPTCFSSPPRVDSVSHSRYPTTRHIRETLCTTCKVPSMLWSMLKWSVHHAKTQELH